MTNVKKCGHSHHVHIKKSSVKLTLDLTHEDANIMYAMAQQYTEGGCMSHFAKELLIYTVKEMIKEEIKEADGEAKQ